MGDANVLSGNIQSGIYVFNGSTNTTIEGNIIGYAADGASAVGNIHSGIWVEGGAEAQVFDNQIGNNARDGVTVAGSGTQTAIYGNTIADNTDIGIDFDNNGVTANDPSGGDADSGPNDLLNFPVINSVGADGSASLNYDITLDVPANTPGYRIDFFKNTSADPTGFGEGEIYLGTIDVPGAGNHTGTLTARVTVDIGDIISTTTTRKTGTLTYDITSEFSQNATAVDADPASLTVAKTVAPLNAGDYDLPGSDVVYTFAVTNEGDGAVDTDSIILIDSLPPEIIFYYGDHDGPGPSTDVVGFEETSTSLSFDPNSDALFSNGTTKPSDLSECNYTPSAGYDPNVKYVCFNPKGRMLGGDPNPNFNIRFRARIQ